MFPFHGRTSCSIKTVKPVLDQKIDFRIGMDGFQTIIWLVNSEL